MKDYLSTVSPKYWHLGIGIVLMLSVFVIPNGIAGVADSLRRRFGRPS